jgi:hypothetical protein
LVSYPSALTRPSIHLVIQLLIRNLLRLRLLPTQEPRNPIIRTASHNKTRAHGSLAICDDTLASNLLNLLVVCAENVVLPLSTFLQREENDRFPLGKELACWLLDDGKFRVDGGEGVVADGIGFLDVRRNVFVGFREIGDEGFADLFVGCGG